MQNPILSMFKFILVVDEEKILFDAGLFRLMLWECTRYRERGVLKKCLLGSLPPSLIRKFSLYLDDVHLIQQRKNNPLWRLIVDFAD